MTNYCCWLMTDYHDDDTHFMDLSGLYCPEPVMLLHNKIREVNVGETIRLLATDPSTERDIPKFCHFLGHELLQSDAKDGKFFYLIQKGKGRQV